MVFIRPILYGNMIDVEVKEDDRWVDGELVTGGLHKLGKGIVMPWNIGKDYKFMEFGGYSTNDRKLYSNEILHDKTDTKKSFEVTIGNEKFQMTYISEWNEASLNKYGLKRI